MSASEASLPVKGHCPDCGPNRLADVVGHYHKRDDDENVWAETDYRILRCRGCDTVYFQTDLVFSEDWDYEVDPHTGKYEGYYPHKITYWPAPSKRDQPAWSSELFVIDGDLASLFDDIYVALNNELRVLSAIGIRTAFDRASELLGVDSDKSFADKLTELVQLGKIGTSERDTLNILTDAGSAAAHRGWKPAPKELDTMMNIIEALFHRAFIVEAAAKRLKENVPPRMKRHKP